MNDKILSNAVEEYNKKVFEITGSKEPVKTQELDYVLLIKVISIVFIPSLVVYFIAGEVGFGITMVVMLIAYGGPRIMKIMGHVVDKINEKEVNYKKLLTPFFNDIICNAILKYASEDETTCQFDSGIDQDLIRDALIVPKKRKYIYTTEYIHIKYKNVDFKYCSIRAKGDNNDGRYWESLCLYAPLPNQTTFSFQALPDHFERYFGDSFNKIFLKKSRAGNPHVVLDNREFEEFFLCYSNDKIKAKMCMSAIQEPLLKFRQIIGKDCYLHVGDKGILFFWKDMTKCFPDFTGKVIKSEEVERHAENAKSLFEKIDPIINAMIKIRKSI